jgi:hypothetical protein
MITFEGVVDTAAFSIFSSSRSVTFVSTVAFGLLPSITISLDSSFEASSKLSL